MFTFFKNLFNRRESGHVDDKNLIELFKMMRNEAKNEIEKLYVESWRDVSKRKDFYLLFSDSEFYFLGGKKNESNFNNFYEDTKTYLEMPVFTIQNELMYPFFTSHEKLEEATHDKSENCRRYFKCKLKNLFNESFQHSFIMNPGSSLVKIFTLKELASIFDGSILDSFSSIKNGTTFEIGIPAKKPKAFLKSLILYAKKNDEIKSIYLAQMNDEVNGLRSVIAVEFKQNVEGKAKYFEDIFELGKKNFKHVSYEKYDVYNEKPYIDFTELNEKNQIANLIKENGEQIY